MNQNLSPANNNSLSGVASPNNAKRRTILLNGGSSINTGVITTTHSHHSTPNLNSTQQNSVQVSQNVQSPSVASVSTTPNLNSQQKSVNTTPITSGIVKNVYTDVIKRGFLFKWFRSVFTTIPFTLDNDVTTFQIYPDYSGQTLNQSGNVCDQVIIYGQVPIGFISENNDVEVFGSRDSKFRIIAKTIKNTASGSTIKAHWSLGHSIVKIITLVLLFAIFGLISYIMGDTQAQQTLLNFVIIAGVIGLIIFIIKHPKLLLLVILGVFGFFHGIFKNMFR
jgi:hypothetical protein